MRVAGGSTRVAEPLDGLIAPTAGQHGGEAA